MPGPILHVGAVVTCAHGGVAQPTAPFPRVLVLGQPVTTIAPPYAIAGCGLQPVPCATGQWTTGSTRVLAGGMPLALMAGASTCVPTATPMLAANAQVRVVAT